MTEVIEKILNVLPSLRNALDLVETLIMLYLAKNVSGVKKAVKQTVFAETPVSTIKTNPASIKEQLATEFSAGLALYFSGKSEKDMTSEELASYKLVKQYIEEVKKDV